MRNLQLMPNGKLALSTRKSVKPEHRGKDFQGVSETLDLSVVPVFEQIRNRLIDSSIVPENAEIRVREYAGDAVQIDCSWLPTNCSGAPLWSSKVIKILVHGDLVDHFYQATPDIIDQLTDAILKVVSRRLRVRGMSLLSPGAREPFGHEIHVGPQDIEWGELSA